MSRRAGPPVNPFGGAELAEEHLHHAAREYLLRFGWQTTVVDKQLVFGPEQRAAGLVMAAGVAEDTKHLLGMWGIPTPVLCLPGPHPRWVFLAEPYESETDQGIPSPRMTTRAGTIPLPPSVTADGEVSWIISPDDDGVRILDLSSLVLAVNRIATDYGLIMWPR